MILNFPNCGFDVVQPGPGAPKILILVDRDSNVQIHVPLSDEGVEVMVSKLRGIQVATVLPPNGLAPR